MSDLKWLCFGAGALGTYIGGSLALSGDRIVFLEQPAVIDALRHRGLRLDLTIDARRHSPEPMLLAPGSVTFAGSLEEALHHGPFDVGIYALKSFDTPAALNGMASFARELPPICCFSNGIDNEPAIAEMLGLDRVISATVTTAVGRKDAGDIVLEKLRGIGIAATHPLSRRLGRAANAAYLNARLFGNAAAMKWSKLLSNLVANATSAILDMTAAEIFGDPRLCELEMGMLRECLAVMRIQKIPVVDLPGMRLSALPYLVRLPLWAARPLLARVAGSGRGGKMPSFHIDLHSGRGKSEVEFLHGAVAREGRKFGVRTPINDLLTQTLMAMTRGEISLQEYRGQPARLLSALRA